MSDMKLDINKTEQFKAKVYSREPGISLIDFAASLNLVTIQAAAAMFDRKATGAFRRLMTSHGVIAKRISGQDFYDLQVLELVKDKIPANRAHKETTRKAIYRDNIKTVNRRLDILEARLQFLESELGVRR